MGSFSAPMLAEMYLKADPTDPSRQHEVTHLKGELARMRGAFAPQYDPATTDLTSSGKLRVGGVERQNLTSLVDELAAWLWPDPTLRPKSVYKDFSGHAHGSLDADPELWEVVNSPTRRDLTRRLPPDFVDSNVLMAIALFHHTFQRLVGFYGWYETPLNEYGDATAAAFPTRFVYST